MTVGAPKTSGAAPAQLVLSLITNAPFKNSAVRGALSPRSHSFSSPYWVSAKTLRRLRADVKPQERRRGVTVDSGNVPHNIKRMPSKLTFLNRIPNAELRNRVDKKDLTQWFNVDQVACAEKLTAMVGKTKMLNGVTGQRIRNKKVHEALLSVAGNFKSPYWIAQEDVTLLRLSTRENIQPIAVSYKEGGIVQSRATTRMQSGGLVLPTLLKSHLHSEMFYNLDHFADERAAQSLRHVYPYRVFRGIRENYAESFAKTLLAVSLERGYKSPQWFTPHRIEKRRLRIVRDEYYSFTAKDQEQRFYNKDVLSGFFLDDSAARFSVHYSLYHRLKLPLFFQGPLHESVRVNQFDSNYWLTSKELKELGLTLLPNQKTTLIRPGQNQEYELYNVEQTVPLV